jgi:hypothetical protein
VNASNAAPNPYLVWECRTEVRRIPQYNFN